MPDVQVTVSPGSCRNPRHAEYSEQLTRVRDVRSMINRIICNVDSHSSVTIDDPVMVLKSVVNALNDALGDTDD